MSILEAVTLLCFGASWPFAIARTYASKTAQGKSLAFLSLVLLGYLCAVVNKFLFAPGDWIVWLWTINGVMVAIDLTLSIYYRRAGER